MSESEHPAPRQLLAPWLQTLSAASDDRGTLLEMTNAGVPGQTWCRVFTLSTEEPSARGGHAHRLCTQALIAIAGKTVVRSRGIQGEFEFGLESRTTALIVPPMNWLSIDMGPKATLAVLADRPYERDDYIYDLSELLGRSKE